MINLVYCKQSLRTNSNQELNKVLNKLCNYYTIEDTIKTLTKNSDKYIYKASDYRYYFIISTIKIEGKGDFKFLYLFDYIRRDNHNYNQFTNSIASKNVFIEEDELSIIEKDIIKKIPEEKLNTLSNDDYLFFEKLEHLYDFDILESALWINEVQTDYFAHNWIKIKDAIRNLITTNEDVPIYIQNKNYSIKEYKYQNQSIHFDHYERNSKNYYILHSFNVNNKKKFEAEISKIYLKINDNTTLEERLRIIGRRAYLNNIFLEDDIEFNKDQWVKLEYDNESNLALSKEEEEILQKQELPLFINGQAGSGKSTILYYLLAEYLYKFIEKEKFEDIIFLTYSEHLNKKAYENVLNILLTNQNFENKKHVIEKSKNIIRKCFYPFKDFIRNELLKTKNTFNIEEQITFLRFRNWYNGSDSQNNQANFCLLRNKRNFSPELVWFVIRTFIKGYNPNFELSPDEYKKIPGKDQIIEYEIYKEIYNTIWLQWYKQLLTKYWDDQDLVTEGLKLLNSNKPKSFSIIICDEAQDFTRIEINLIINLFKYLKYDLSVVDSTPIAFAGDPYQSINPTGFSFERLKDSFYSEFKKYNFYTSLNTNELTINFRSVEQIVKLANFVQLLRRGILDIADLKPQTFIKQGDDTNIPIFWELEKDINLNQIKEFDWDIILVPDDNIDEMKNDKYLESFIQNGRATNIFKVFDFKGDEREFIILYKFGHYFVNKLNINFIEYLKNKEFDENTEYKLKNFFNILYVAVTRAKSKLRIIDTKEAYENFWRNFNVSTAEQIYNKFEDEDWQDYISSLKKDNFDTELIKKDTYLKGSNKTQQEKIMQADSFYQKGIDEKRTDYLQRAIESYHRLECSEKEQLALSYYYEFLFQYNEAALIAFQLDDKERTIKLFWKGQNWEKINELTANYNVTKYITLNKITNFILDKDSIEIFDIVDDWVNNINSYEYDWTFINEKIYTYCLNNINTIFNYNDKAVRTALKKLSDYFCDDRLTKLIGFYYYNSGRYEEALDIWNKFNDHSGYKNEYFIACGNVAKNLDEKIQFYVKVDTYYDLVLNAFEDKKFDNTKLSIFSLDKVAECYKYIKAYSKYLDINFRIITKFLELKKPEEWRKRIKEAIVSLSGLEYSVIISIDEYIVFKYFNLVIKYTQPLFTNFFYKLLIVLTGDKIKIAKEYFNVNHEFISDIKVDDDKEEEESTESDQNNYLKRNINFRLKFFIIAVTNPFTFYLQELYNNFKYKNVKFSYNRIKLLTYELVEEPFVAYETFINKENLNNKQSQKINKDYFNNILAELKPISELCKIENEEDYIDYEIIKNYKNLSSSFNLFLRNKIYSQKSQNLYKIIDIIKSTKNNPSINSLNVLYKEIIEISNKEQRSIGRELRQEFEKHLFLFVRKYGLFIEKSNNIKCKKEDEIIQPIRNFAKSLLIDNIINHYDKHIRLDEESVLLNYLYLVKLYEFASKTIKYNQNDSFDLQLIKKNNYNLNDLLDLQLNKNYKVIFSNYKEVYIKFKNYLWEFKKNDPTLDSKLNQTFKSINHLFNIGNREPIISYKLVLIELIFNFKSYQEDLSNKNSADNLIKNCKEIITYLEKQLSKFNDGIDLIINNFDKDFEAELNFFLDNTYTGNLSHSTEPIEEIQIPKRYEIELKSNETKKIEGLHIYLRQDRVCQLKIKLSDNENSEFTIINLENLKISSNEIDEIIEREQNLYYIKYLNIHLRIIDKLNYEIEKEDVLIKIKLVL